nr:5E5 antigen-like [Aegilops tauschii subsp. strangulata]
MAGQQGMSRAAAGVELRREAEASTGSAPEGAGSNGQRQAREAAVDGSQGTARLRRGQAVAERGCGRGQERGSRRGRAHSPGATRGRRPRPQGSSRRWAHEHACASAQAGAARSRGPRAVGALSGTRARVGAGTCGCGRPNWSQPVGATTRGKTPARDRRGSSEATAGQQGMSRSAAGVELRREAEASTGAAPEGAGSNGRWQAREAAVGGSHGTARLRRGRAVAERGCGRGQERGSRRGRAHSPGATLGRRPRPQGSSRRWAHTRALRRGQAWPGAGGRGWASQRELRWGDERAQCARRERGSR